MRTRRELTEGEGRRRAVPWGRGEPGCRGDCLSVEAVGRGKGSDGNRAGAANHLRTRWGVRRARGTYGYRALTQPVEHVLPIEGGSE